MAIMVYYGDYLETHGFIFIRGMVHHLMHKISIRRLITNAYGRFGFHFCPGLREGLNLIKLEVEGTFCWL